MVEVLPDAQVKVLVAVADVAAFVTKNSAIDAHAGHNTTSVYTAGGIFPILPDEFSTDRTSLNYQEDPMGIYVKGGLDTPSYYWLKPHIL